MAQLLSLLDTQISDLNQLLPLIHDFYQLFDYAYIEAAKRLTLEELFQNQTMGRIWLIQDNHTVVGYVYLSFYFSLEFGGRTAFLDELFILPAYRGKGFGSQVINLIEQRCTELNFRALHLESERKNEAATSLYERLGFVDYDRRLLTKLLPSPLSE
jgi:GNAT superfamily N-acetyltransferase